MKKIIVCMLSILILSAFMPMVAFGETGIAKIGDKTFNTLQEAVDSITDSTTETTITLLKDAAGGGVVVKEGSKIVFDFAGFTYTVNDPTVGSAGTETLGFQLLKDSTITFKNGTLKHGGSANLKMMIQNYSNLTIQDMTIDGVTGNAAEPCQYVLSNNNGVTKITGKTSITAPEGAKAFDACVSKYYPDGAQVIVDTTGTITGDIEYGVWDDITGLENKTTIQIKQIDHKGEISVDPKLETAASEGKISVSGGTFTSDVTQYVEPGFSQDSQGNVVEITYGLSSDSKDQTIYKGKEKDVKYTFSAADGAIEDCIINDNFVIGDWIEKETKDLSEEEKNAFIDKYISEDVEFLIDDVFKGVITFKKAFILKLVDMGVLKEGSNKLSFIVSQSEETIDTTLKYVVEKVEEEKPVVKPTDDNPKTGEAATSALQWMLIASIAVLVSVCIATKKQGQRN